MASCERFRLSEAMPCLPVANSQQAANHRVRGVRARSNIGGDGASGAARGALELPVAQLPAVAPQAQAGQTKPVGQRSHSR